MNDNQKVVLDHASIQLQTKEQIEEEDVHKYVEFFSQLNPLSDKEKEEVEFILQSRLNIKMDRGFVIKQEHTSWYYAAKKDLDDSCWRRYSSYLLNGEVGLGPSVVHALDKDTDEIMDLLENPKNNGEFKRRGLVIGDVQAGKTSTYIALLNKAADAGYKFLFVLTGTIEKLRRQTQERINSGFLGIEDDSMPTVGIGVTSVDSDFNSSTACKLIGRWKDLNVPVMFVLKKNKHVLESLHTWLKRYNTDCMGKIDVPMLMIDDEADNASVSTKEENDPTTINKNIRNILKLFKKSCYVGFTATPFANIFINPDTTDEMFGDDLFPQDFIYALNPPSNYIGAYNVFPEKGEYHYMLKDNSDCEKYVPLRHKKNFIPGDLPESLKEAVASFFIVNAIRDIRGQETKHRTMMVNISIYIDVQKAIAEQLDEYVRRIQVEIRNYYKIKDAASRYPFFSFLKEVYEKYYSNCYFHEKKKINWGMVQEALRASQQIEVHYVNGGNAPKTLNYDKHKKEGLRLIAVGGYSLSRGLTLEGLAVSYFYRNTRMYDTLMQMGRWFGYRSGYADLCQVWINQDAVDWYSYISEASKDLKEQIKSMEEEGKTPRDFGLCVRSDEAALLVTAKNKMKTANEVVLVKTVSGEILQTPYISNRTSEQERIFHIADQFVKSISDYRCKHPEDLSVNKETYLNVPKEKLVEFLRLYKSHILNRKCNTDQIASFVEDSEEKMLDVWDVVIASADGVMSVNGKTVNCVIRRKFKNMEDLGAIQLNEEKAKLGTEMYARGALTKKQVERVKSEIKNRSLAPKDYMNEKYLGEKRKPLLVIYPVQLESDLEAENCMRMKIFAKNITVPLIGLEIYIPSFNGEKSTQYRYMVNLVKYREMMNDAGEYEEEED